MCKNKCVFLFLLISNIIQAQDKLVINGALINSENSAPISYSTLEILGKGVGNVTDSIGKFNLEIPIDINESDTIIIKSLGYKDTLIVIRDLLKSKENIIEMTFSTYQLNEIEFVEKKGMLKKGVYAESTKSGYTLPNWSQIAVLMENQEQLNGIIKNVSFFIVKNPAYKAPFRIRLYGVNEDGSPGEDLVFKNIIANSKKKNKWVTVDVSKYEIPIPTDGYFVAMEWIYTSQKYFFLKTILDNEIQYYGQNLGNIVTKISESPRKTWKYLLGKGWEKDSKSYNVSGNKFGRNALISSEIRIGH